MGREFETRRSRWKQAAKITQLKMGIGYESSRVIKFNRDETLAALLGAHFLFASKAILGTDKGGANIALGEAGNVVVFRRNVLLFS